jgi:hypothetical protein
MNIV